MSKQTDLDEYRRRAELGDVNALLELAWEYVRGEWLSKDLGAAFALLRQLEAIEPQFARFNLAKVKILEHDLSFVDDIRSDCDAGYGPALYLMGVHAKNSSKGDLQSAIAYFDLAANSGHLPSKFLVWRLSELGFWRRLTTFVSAHRLFFRMIALMARDMDDVRILT